VLVRVIPDALTIIRILATIALVVALMRKPYLRMGEVLILFAMIFASDILDGRIARHFGTVSRFGSVLDIFADVFYVVTVTTALVVREIIPIIILVCMVTEFVVYFVTARMLGHRVAIAPYTLSAPSPLHPLPIERIGKSVVLFYFAIPPLALLVRWTIFAEWPIQAITVLCLALTAIAVINRLKMVAQSRDTR
jgi:phosphatidylglycerophosphate synthase